MSVRNRWAVLGLGLVTVGLSLRLMEVAVAHELRDAGRRHPGSIELDAALSLLAVATVRSWAAARPDDG